MQAMLLNLSGPPRTRLPERQAVICAELREFDYMFFPGDDGPQPPSTQQYPWIETLFQAASWVCGWNGQPEGLGAPGANRALVWMRFFFDNCNNLPGNRSRERAPAAPDQSPKPPPGPSKFDRDAPSSSHGPFGPVTGKRLVF